MMDFFFLILVLYSFLKFFNFKHNYFIRIFSIDNSTSFMPIHTLSNNISPKHLSKFYFHTFQKRSYENKKTCQQYRRLFPGLRTNTILYKLSDCFFCTLFEEKVHIFFAYWSQSCHVVNYTQQCNLSGVELKSSHTCPQRRILCQMKWASVAWKWMKSSNADSTHF